MFKRETSYPVHSQHLELDHRNLSAGCRVSLYALLGICLARKLNHFQDKEPRGRKELTPV